MYVRILPSYATLNPTIYWICITMEKREHRDISEKWRAAAVLKIEESRYLILM